MSTKHGLEQIARSPELSPELRFSPAALDVVEDASDAQVGGRRRGYVLMAAVLVTLMVGNTLPVGLYGFWAHSMRFGPLGVTVVYVAVVVGTLAVLLPAGDLSDHFGRKKVLGLAILLAAASTAVFLGSSSIGLLIVGRLVDGVAIGLGLGTATAALAELQPRHNPRAAAIVATGGLMVGVAAGAVLGGVFAQYVSGPTSSVFWAYLGLLALALALLVAIPETVGRPDGVFRPQLRLGVPKGTGLVVLGSSFAVFAALGVAGVFSSLVPSFVEASFGATNLALVTGATALLFVAGAISQALFAGVAGRRGVSTGLIMLAAGLAAFEVSLFARLLWLFILATVAAGTAVGVVMRGGLSEINRVAVPERRAEAVSTFFAAGYGGMGIPALGIGLISLATSTLDASTYIAILVGLMIAAGLATVLLGFGRPSRPKAPGR